MIDFDHDILGAKVKAIVDRVVCAAIETELGRTFGVQARFDRIECRYQHNLHGSSDFLRRVLMNVPGTQRLQERFADMIARSFKHAKELRKSLDEIEQKTVERWSLHDYNLRNTVDDVVRAIAHEHAKEDFLTILQKVGDNLQKEVDTTG